MLLVWRLWRIMLTPQGREERKRETKKIFTSLEPPGISASHPHAETQTLTEALITCSPVFCAATPALFYSADVSYSVFNKNLCVEEKGHS